MGGVWKNIEIFLKLYMYVYSMLMVTEFLTICPVICLKSRGQDVDLGQTGFISMIFNVSYLIRGGGRGQKVMRRDLISGKC